MKSKASIFNFPECDVENRVIAFVSVYSKRIRVRVVSGLLFLEGKMDRELEKRREFHMSTLFLLWLHAQWRVGFVEHRGHSQGHTVDREGPCMFYKGV